MCFVKHDKVVWKLRQNIVSNTITTVLHTREKKLYKLMDEAFCLLQTAAKEVIILIVLQSPVSRLSKDGGHAKRPTFVYLHIWNKNQCLRLMTDRQIFICHLPTLWILCVKKSEKKKSFHEWLTLPVKWEFPFQVDQECSDSWRGGGWGSPKVYQAC